MRTHIADSSCSPAVSFQTIPNFQKRYEQW
ncbi:ATP synthase subunit 9, mitochondrial, partial [Cryptococcus neoformans Bt1]